MPRKLPRLWLASLCLAAIAVSGCNSKDRGAQSGGAAVEGASAPVERDKSAPQTEEEKAYAAIVALKRRKDDAELVRVGPAFLEKYPDSPHFEKVASLTGEALTRREDWKAARDCYLRLAERFPKSAEIDGYHFQAALCRLKLKEYKPAAVELEKFLKDYPASGLKEEATYQLAMAHFLNNDYKETLLGCRAYLKAYPEGKHEGDVIYRLAFIDAHDPEVDQTENIIKFLSDFIAKKPADPAIGSLRCLLGDTWLKRKPTNPADPAATAKEIRANEDAALEHFRKAAVSPASVFDVAKYAAEAAENLLTKHGEKEALREFRAEYRKYLEASRQRMIEGEGE